MLAPIRCETGSETGAMRDRGRLWIEVLTFQLALLGGGLVVAGLCWLGLRSLDGSAGWVDARFVWIGLVGATVGCVATRLAARRRARSGGPAGDSP